MRRGFQKLAMYNGINAPKVDSLPTYTINARIFRIFGKLYRHEAFVFKFHSLNYRIQQTLYKIHSIHSLP